MADLDNKGVQRVVIAAAYLIILALLGTCVAGGLCLVQRCGAPVECPGGGAPALPAP
jgi:hypothetical protein